MKKIEEKKIKKWLANSYTVVMASLHESVSIEVYSLRSLNRFQIRDLHCVKRERKRIQAYATVLSDNEANAWVKESFFETGKKLALIPDGRKVGHKMRLLDNNYLEKVSLRGLGID